MYRVSARQQGIYHGVCKEAGRKGRGLLLSSVIRSVLESLCQTVIGDKEIIIYDKHCLGLSARKRLRQILQQACHLLSVRTIRSTGTTTFHDEIYGDITVDNAELDDMILIKSDGYPDLQFC